jgi:hypothetical protein
MKNLLKIWSVVIVLTLGAGQAAGQFVWTKDARNPILSGGATGAWNNQLIAPCVLYNPDSSRYEMWFSASYGNPPDYRPWQVGRAVSKDGINWKIDSSAVMPADPSAWDNSVEIPWVIRENGQYKMWYEGNVNGQFHYCVGFATSTDGIHWSKYAGNPVMAPGKATWEAQSIYGCAILPFAGGYKMWYGAFGVTGSGNVGYAVSADGITWRRDTVNNPVLKAGTLGEWDSNAVSPVQVLNIHGTYYLWYIGWQNPADLHSVGVATSKDTGKTWTKYAGNPVLLPSGGQQWDGTYAEVGTVLLRGDTLDMWYDGSWENHAGWDIWKIGHATSPLVLNAVNERQGEVPQHFILSQNYPNPFNPSTTIKFELPKTSHVILTVCDVLGREVSVLVNEKREAGVHRVSFDGSNLASGVYFYRLQAGGFVQTKKMLILR